MIALALLLSCIGFLSLGPCAKSVEADPMSASAEIVLDRSSIAIHDDLVCIDVKLGYHHSDDQRPECIPGPSLTDTVVDGHCNVHGQKGNNDSWVINIVSPTDSVRKGGNFSGELSLLFGCDRHCIYCRWNTVISASRQDDCGKLVQLPTWKGDSNFSPPIKVQLQPHGVRKCRAVGIRHCIPGAHPDEIHTFLLPEGKCIQELKFAPRTMDWLPSATLKDDIEVLEKERPKGLVIGIVCSVGLLIALYLAWDKVRSSGVKARVQGFRSMRLPRSPRGSIHKVDRFGSGSDIDFDGDEFEAANVAHPGVVDHHKRRASLGNGVVLKDE